MTTATTAGTPAFRENRFLQRLCIAAAAVTLIAAYHPDQMFDFLLENGTMFVFIAVLVCTYRLIPFSDLSYLLIFLFFCLHEWGAHHKYTDVPLGEWMKVWLNTNRNHYDRVAHFAFGLLIAYPTMELFIRRARVTGNWRYYLPVEFVLALSATYEMLEAAMAHILTPQRTEEFVGMQGDLWDSQKDMFVATLGALIGMLLVWAGRRYRSSNSQPIN